MIYSICLTAIQSLKWGLKTKRDNPLFMASLYCCITNTAFSICKKRKQDKTTTTTTTHPHTHTHVHAHTHWRDNHISQCSFLPLDSTQKTRFCNYIIGQKPDSRRDPESRLNCLLAEPNSFHVAES